MGADAWERAATATSAPADRASLDEVDDRGRVRVLHFVLRRRRAEPPGAEPSRRRRRTRGARRGARPARARARRVHPGPPGARTASSRCIDARRAVRTTRRREHHQHARRTPTPLRSTPTSIMALTRKLRDAGSPFWPQMSPRTIDFRINWETSMVFMMLSAWHRIPNAADDANVARLLEDPEWRAAARARVGRGTDAACSRRSIPSVCASSRSPSPSSSRGWAGPSPTSSRPAAVTRPTCSPTGSSRTICGPACSSSASANSNVDEVAELLVDPDTVVASSDAGAHVQMMCAAGDTTLFLAPSRARPRRPRASSRRSTSSPASRPTCSASTTAAASQPGLGGRPHRVRARRAALGRRRVRQRPARRARRLRRPEGGYRYTIANGEVTQEDGVLTGARPAGVLHSAVG